MSLVRTIYRTARASLRHYRSTAKHRKIFHRFRNYTMIPEADYIHTLEIAKQAQAIKGCVVECGVWRGGMVAGLSSVLGGSRKYYLFDSFEGMPPAKDIDGPAAKAWEIDTDGPNYHDNCSASPDYAAEAMSLAGVSDFELVKGWFENTLPRFEFAEPIAVLHFDGDWYESAKICLTSLFDFVAPGGIVILDDYYIWDGCSRALHDFLSHRAATERIRILGSICYIVKAA